MLLDKQSEMVKSFYEQSFDQLSKFHEISISQISQLYQNSYENFLEIVVIIGSVIAFATTFGLWWLKKDTKKRLIKIEEKYQKKLDEDLKKFQEEFEKKTKTLESQIYASEARSSLFQGLGSENVGIQLALYASALDAAIISEQESIISAILDRIITSLKKAKKDSLIDNGFVEKILKKLTLFKKGKEGAIVHLINQVEEEFKKAKERE
ncbi:MAG: hypothetical protein FJ368_05940 [Pelagibacterales bacterium]|nr:hypothetical protein [Pelagibacterales bacterium]